MPRYAAFLRAVNVGGRFVKMAALRDALTDAGLTGVTTYIQSGNVLFTSPLRSPAKVEAQLERILSDFCGFEVVTMVRTQDQLAELVRAGNELADPFSGSGPGARHMVSVHKLDPDGEAPERIAGWPEPGVRGLLVGRELHLYYKIGLMESKLTPPKIAKLVGSPGTAREWRVVEAVNAALQAG